MKKNRASELAVLLPELEVEAMLLEAVGDAAAVETVLQLTHAVVVEGGAVDRVGHGDLGTDLRRVLLHSRPYPRRDRRSHNLHRSGGAPERMNATTAM